jgi:hypothetical protein
LTGALDPDTLTEHHHLNRRETLMTEDSSSTDLWTYDDRRFRCRVCGLPRLRAVALLADRLTRIAFWAQPLCYDEHEPEPPHADENPLLDSVDLTCPLCKGIVNVTTLMDYQHERCEDCDTQYTVHHDGTRWVLHAEPPENPRETTTKGID